MTRDIIAGAMYGECLPSGFFAVMIPRVHCLTHLGIVPFPDGETFGPLFLRCTDVGGFRFAGQAHDTENPAAYERIGSAWVSLPPPCFGVSPLIYDWDGNLHCSNGSVGSQGYRYVTPNNVLISGDSTYGPFHGLFEYTYLEDGLWIGQGATDGSGVRVLESQTDEQGRIVYVLRQLEPGDCRFIRANRVNDRVALAFSRPEGVVLIQTTMAELRALPLVGLLKHPGPINTEEQEPMQAKPLPADVHAIVVALHAKHLDLAKGSDDERRALQQLICETVRAREGPRWGWKSNHGVNVANAKDAIAQLPDGASVTLGLRQPLYMWDLFNGTTREPNPLPVMSETEHTDQFFVPVEPIDHLAGSVPPVVVPPPAHPPVDDRAPLVAQLEALSVIVAQLNAVVMELKADVEALASRPVVDQAAVGAAVAAMLEGYEVRGKTATSFGHQHSVKLAIRRTA